jgi:outer membrane protein OmpA-like peptidoglycan-associated protein
MNRTAIAALVVASVAFSGCAATDPDRRAKSGAAIGAVTGAILGHQIDNDKGRIIGAAIGAITGAAAGNYMDEQQRELDRQLAEEQAAKQIALERIDAETLKLRLDSAVTFAFDSDRLRASFYSALNKVASVVGEYDKTAIHVVGHTDSTGTYHYNQSLSERRARSVGSYLSAQGINTQRIVLKGRGESQPLADNRSEFGREQNRRVEIYLKTIVEGREQDAFRQASVRVSRHR